MLASYSQVIHKRFPDTYALLLSTILLLADSCQPATQVAARDLSDTLERLFPSQVPVRTADPLASLDRTKDGGSPPGISCAARHKALRRSSRG